MNTCVRCGANNPDLPCPANYSHKVGSCPSYIESFMPSEGITMNSNHVAEVKSWNILKGKEDAPNYRKATGKEKCGNCKAWDSSKTDDPMTGYCEWYDFICRADHVCDAWAGKE